MSAREEGASALALPDLERRTANMIRFGTIAEVKLTNPPRVKVKSGNITTRWLPWAGGRAGAGKRRWDAPEVGEQALLLCASGDMRQALVIPGIYQSSFAAPSDDGNLDLTEYGDGTKISYDRAAHELVADLGGCKITANRDKIELSIGGAKLTMTSAGSVFDGPVTFNDPITYKGGMTGSGGVGAEITGDFKTSGGVLTHNGKNVGDTHKHNGVQTGGGNTGNPI